MKPNPNLDELLCGFMDGELSPRQRTEVQRMAAHDPQVARRLRQLQNCRTLFCSLPAAKAPGDLLDQIKASLERRTLLQEEPVVARRSAGVWHLAFRRFVSAAAMIALLGVLGAVVYQIVAPVPPGGSSPVAEGQRPSWNGIGQTAVSPIAVADTGFAGRLELRTARLVQADAFIGRAIENSGLPGQIEPDIVSNQRVYRVTGTREGVNRLVASLSGVWQSFDSAALHVDRPEGPAAAVVVEGITPEQTANIVAQASARASVEAAAGYAVMNRMAKNMPGSEVRSLIQNDPGYAMAPISIPRPVETGPENSTPRTQAPRGKAEVTLTIVLRSTI
jgi:hypothetical protein